MESNNWIKEKMWLAKDYNRKKMDLKFSDKLWTFICDKYELTSNHWLVNMK